MAIAHLRATFVGKGRSAVASAAYRHRATMFDGSKDQAVSYAAKRGDLVHEDLVLPPGAPAWAHDLVAGRSIAKGSEALWNAVTAFEKRADATLSRELEMALPRELDRAEWVALVQDFVASEITPKGFVADWVIHNPYNAADPDAPDQAAYDNPHVHLMHTLRPLRADGFGPKVVRVQDAGGAPIVVDGKYRYTPFVGGPKELIALRLAWGDVVNRHLQLAGHDTRIDMRSYADQGVAITPTTHIGPEPKGMADRLALEMHSHSLADHARSRARATADIISNPGALLVKISRERSTFSERDIVRELHRYVDDAALFGDLLARIKALPELVVVRPEVRDPEAGHMVAPAVYATRDLVQAEHNMMVSVQAMAAVGGFAVGAGRIAASVSRVEGKDAARPFVFAPEQLRAVRHVTGPAGIAAVIGYAGAGKSTLLEAAHLAWAADGRRVMGAALSGKAAQGLQDGSGIASRTLAAWELAWAQERDLVRRGDVFVIDEAGMVGSRQMARVMAVVAAAGAKIVLVGDAKQLQPIEAGAAFRAITERIEPVVLVDVRRQKVDWAKAATMQFGAGSSGAALDAYNDRGRIAAPVDRPDATRAIVADWSEARAGLEASGKPLRGDELLVLAHTNADVFALNAGIRGVLADEGALTQPRIVETERGPREFAAGDRIIFLKNEKFIEAAAPELGRQAVKNGMLGVVMSTGADADNRPGDGLLRVRLDSGPEVAFRPGTYRNVDHGYATTIHKAQGATVDRVFVLATASMDQSLTYVAMSRHRHEVTLYAPKSEFRDYDHVKAVLSRERGKTTTLDYAPGRGDAAIGEDFARRRGIDTVADIAPAFATWIEKQRSWIAEQRLALAKMVGRLETAIGLVQSRMVKAAPVQEVVELTPAAPKQKLSFTNLGLKPTRDVAVAPPAPVRDPATRALGDYLEQRLALENLAKRRIEPAVYQTDNRNKAVTALEAIRPRAIQVLESAIRHDAGTRSAMATLTGPDLVNAVAAGINREAKALADPEVRASRLVVQGQALIADFNRAGRDRWGEVVPAMAERLRAFAAELTRDPEAQAALHRTPEKFGLKPDSILGRAATDPNMGQALTKNFENIIDPPSHSFDMSR